MFWLILLVDFVILYISAGYALAGFKPDTKVSERAQNIGAVVADISGVVFVALVLWGLFALGGWILSGIGTVALALGAYVLYRAVKG